MKTLVLLLSLALMVASTQAAFCPKDKGDRCRADRESYKCGVFYKKLIPSRRLIWIGALPDALDKDNQDDWKEILGPNASNDSFSGPQHIQCTNPERAKRTANSRCYTILNDLANTRLDSCGSTVLNSRSSSRKKKSIGDSLCEVALRFLKQTRKWTTENMERNGFRNQKLTFQYSYCNQGNPWQPVKSGGRNLEVAQELCCHGPGNTDPALQNKYYNCDGTPIAAKGC